MNEEKLNRTIEFILENQAKFYTDLQEIQETNKQIQKAHKELFEAHKDADKRIGTLERVSLNLYNNSVEQGKNIAQLSGEVKELRESQKETTENLNAVILMFEKYLSGENGGGSPRKGKK